LHLALFLRDGGDLRSLINNYRSKKAPYVTESIYDTLMMNLVYLRTGEFITELNTILSERLNESQLIDLFSAELRELPISQIAPNNTGFGTPFKLDMTCRTRYDLEKYAKEYPEPLDKIIYGEDLVGKLDIFTETRERLAADNPWLWIAKEIEDDEYKNPTDAVHMQDRLIIESFNASAKDEYRLRLNLPPEPFQGNPLDAEVVILTLNPGFVEKCNVGKYNALTEAEQKEFVKAKCLTMSMQDELCVPDDDVINDIGEGYWKRKLKAALEIPDANKKIAVIQFLGYFSYKAIPKKYFGGDEPLLYTQEYTMRLIRYLMQEEKVIIIARREKEWYRHIPELEYYEKKILLVNYRNPTISQGNCIDKDNGWKLIEAALKK